MTRSLQLDDKPSIFLLKLILLYLQLVKHGLIQLQFLYKYLVLTIRVFVDLLNSQLVLLSFLL